MDCTAQIPGCLTEGVRFEFSRERQDYVPPSVKSSVHALASVQHRRPDSIRRRSARRFLPHLPDPPWKLIRPFFEVYTPIGSKDASSGYCREFVYGLGWPHFRSCWNVILPDLRQQNERLMLRIGMWQFKPADVRPYFQAVRMPEQDRITYFETLIGGLVQWLLSLAIASSSQRGTRWLAAAYGLMGCFWSGAGQSGLNEPIQRATSTGTRYASFFRQVTELRNVSGPVMLNGQPISLTLPALRHAIGITEKESQAVSAVASSCEARIREFDTATQPLIFDARVRIMEAEGNTSSASQAEQQLKQLSDRRDEIVLAQIAPSGQHSVTQRSRCWILGFVRESWLSHFPAWSNKKVAPRELCTGFAVLALLMACVGLYGTMSYNVTRQVGEIGVRMALGAQRGAVIRMVLRRVLLLTAVGLAISVPAALIGTRLVKSFLFETQPNDPGTLVRAGLRTKNERISEPVAASSTNSGAIRHRR
jgi:hypothetical protein